MLIRLANLALFMKKTLSLVAFVLLLCSVSNAQKPITGFFDIPFGSDSSYVKDAVKAMGGYTIDTLSQKDMLGFSGIAIGSRHVLFCFVKFVDNKAFEADFVFSDFEQIDALSYFDELAGDISVVYGGGLMSNNFGNYSNDKRIKRLLSGDAYGFTVWRSKNKNAIYLYFQIVNQSLQIILQYLDRDLWNLNAQRRRSKL